MEHLQKDFHAFNITEIKETKLSSMPPALSKIVDASKLLYSSIVVACCMKGSGRKQWNGCLALCHSMLQDRLLKVT